MYYSYSNTAAGDYVLQVNNDGVASGTIKFTVALKTGITDADKTITISAATNPDNKADSCRFISFSNFLFTSLFYSFKFQNLIFK